MTQHNTKQLSQLFEKVEDKSLRAQLYRAVESNDRALELEREVLFDGLSSSGIETRQQYEEAVQRATDLGLTEEGVFNEYISAQERGVISTRAKKQEHLFSREDERAEAVSKSYGKIASGYEARFAARGLEDDLEASFRNRINQLSAAKNTKLYNYAIGDVFTEFAFRYSPREVVGEREVTGEKTVDAMLKYVRDATKALSERNLTYQPRKGEELIRHGVEILTYLREQAKQGNPVVSQTKLNNARVSLLEGMASQFPSLVFVSTDWDWCKEKLDTSNTYWGLRYATATVQRALEFAERLENEGVQKKKVASLKTKIEDTLGKLKDAAGRKTRDEGDFDFDEWRVKLMDEDPKHQSMCSHYAFPTFATLKAGF